jgi:biotin carboxylase
MSTNSEPLVASGIDADIAGKRLLILGAGTWGVEYLRRARLLGAETWATDWSPDAVGRHEAHHFEPIDLKDQDGTLELARRAKVDAVLTAADIGVPTAAFVANHLGLPGAGLQLALDATHKRHMRERASAAGVNCPRFCAIRTVADARRRASLPAIVKPVDNCSSRGVRFVDDGADLDTAVTDALAESRAGEALVEEFLRGDEGSIELFVQDGAPTILGVCDKTKSPLPNRYDLELRYPGAYPTEVSAGIEELAVKLVRGFGIENAILHVEFLVADHRVFLLEFAIRGCGSKVITHLLPELTGIDIVAAVIRQAFGLATPLAPRRQEHGALHFLMFPPGVVRAVHGVAEAGRMPGVIDVCVEREPGDMIGEIRNGRSRPGHVLVRGDSRQVVQERLRAVRDTIRLDYETGFSAGPLDLDTWTYT